MKLYYALFYLAQLLKRKPIRSRSSRKFGTDSSGYLSTGFSWKQEIHLKFFQEFLRDFLQRFFQAFFFRNSMDNSIRKSSRNSSKESHRKYLQELLQESVQKILQGFFYDCLQEFFHTYLRIFSFSLLYSSFEIIIAISLGFPPKTPSGILKGFPPGIY